MSDRNYQLRFQMYAAPSPSSKNRVYAEILSTLAPPRSKNGQPVYCATPFQIAFERERVSLLELQPATVSFRIPLQQTTSELFKLVLVVELWHLPIPKSDPNITTANVQAAATPDQVELKRVQKHKLDLGSITALAEGAPVLQEYVGIDFEEPFYARLGLAVSIFGVGTTLSTNRTRTEWDQFQETACNALGMTTPFAYNDLLDLSSNFLHLWKSYSAELVRIDRSQPPPQCLVSFLSSKRQAYHLQRLQAHGTFMQTIRGSRSASRQKIRTQLLHPNLRVHAERTSTQPFANPFPPTTVHVEQMPTVIEYSALGIVSQHPPTPPVSTRTTPTLDRTVDQLTQGITQSTSSSSVHLIVLVHGLDGSRADLRKFRNILLTSAPSCELQRHVSTRSCYLLSQANEQHSFGDIKEMGSQLVDEILEFVQKDRLVVDRMSFVGHSLGGIVIRSALTDPRMDTYRDCLDTLVTLSTPHLGVVYMENVIVQQLMSWARTIRNSTALTQLALGDHPDVRECFLYQLAKRSDVLKGFRKVILVGSYQDRYVPYHSAMLELDPLALQDPNRSNGSAYVEMMNQMLLPLHTENVHRIDVSFPLAMDDPLGRQAHIALLQNPFFLQQLAIQCNWFLG